MIFDLAVLGCSFRYTNAFTIWYSCASSNGDILIVLIELGKKLELWVLTAATGYVKNCIFAVPLCFRCSQLVGPCLPSNKVVAYPIIIGSFTIILVNWLFYSVYDLTQCTWFLKPSPLTKNNDNTMTMNMITMKMKKIII